MRLKPNLRFRSFSLFRCLTIERLLVLILTLVLLLIYFHNLKVSNVPEISLSAYNQIISANKTPNRLNFTQTFEKFPWDAFKKSASEKNQNEMNKYSELLINELAPFLTLEPQVPINISCTIPPLERKEALLNCSGRKVPKRMGLLLQFGFDVDNLEIHLNELYDIVDKFFIVESTKAHFNFLKKPLIWDLVKKQNRFEKFLDKIVHVVVDEVDIESYANSSRQRGVRKKDKYNSDQIIWKMENIQEAVRWEKFLMWNDATGFFNDDDLIGFGDVDEIASRRTINYLKTCGTEIDPVDIGIWFPFGSIHQAFVSDFPVPGFPFTLGDPTFWRVRTAKMKGSIGYGVPSRNRGTSPTALVGGMHMSFYGYLPLRIVHKISATEGGVTDVSRVKELSEWFKVGKVREMEAEFSKVPSNLSPRVAHMEASKLEELHATRRKVAILPWFYDCNRRRYPSWEGGHDTRLD